MPVTDDTQWIDGPRGRIAVTQAGYRTDFIGQMSYALSEDRIYLHVGYVQNTTIFGSAYRNAVVLAEPAYTISVSGVRSPPGLGDDPNADVVIDGISPGNAITDGRAHRSEGFVDVHASFVWGISSAVTGIQTGSIGYNFMSFDSVISSWGSFLDASTGIYYPLFSTADGLFCGNAAAGGAANGISFDWGSGGVAPPVTLASPDTIEFGFRAVLSPEQSYPV